MSPDALRASLVAAARQEAPSRAAKERAAAAASLVALGVDAASPRPGLSRKLLWKLGGGIGVAGITVALWSGLQPAAPLARTVDDSTSLERNAPYELAPRLVAQDVPAERERAASRSDVPRSTARSPAPRAELVDEITLVRGAKRALASGDLATAMKLLDLHESSYSRGALVEEAEALRVEALARAGRIAEARALATRLLVRYAASPYAHRIRSMTGP